MSCCNHCADVNSIFNFQTAWWDQWRYRVLGPRKSTRLLLKGIRESGVQGKSLLDIGGGIGLVRSELIKEGLSRAVQVDASIYFLTVSKEEAERTGFISNSEFHEGDFTEIAPRISRCDFVTLDRVICCYPDMEKLVGLSVRKATETYGLVYPKNTLLGQVAFGFVNTWFRLTGKTFRIYLHPEKVVDEIITSKGFSRVFSGDTIFWRTAVYRK